MLHFQELLVHSASPASRGFLIRITDKSGDHCVIIVCILIRTFFTLAFVANYVMARQDERARVYNCRWHSQRRRALLGTYNRLFEVVHAAVVLVYDSKSVSVYCLSH